MDEIKAIEKSLSDLKTIKNRLENVLKNKAPIDEITKQNARISSLSAQVNEYFYDNLNLESDLANNERIILILKKQRRILIDELKKTRKINLLHIFDITDDEYNKKEYGEIILPEKYLKFRKNGKWGIKDNRGRIIIENKYDEIGSYNSKFVGFLYGEAEYIKDVPLYNYSIPVAGKFKYSNNLGYAFDVGGVDCYIPASSEKERWFIAGEYYYLIIDKMKYIQKEIELTEVTFENTQVKRWKQKIL